MLLQNVTKLIQNNQYIHRFAFTPDNQYLVVTENRSMYFWELNSFQVAFEISEHPDKISSLSFEKTEGKILASSDYSGNIILWDWQKNKNVYSIYTNLKKINELAFLNNKQQLICNSLLDNKTLLWNIQNGQRLNQLNFYSNLPGSLSPNDEFIAYYINEKIEFINLINSNINSSFDATDGFFPINYSPDSNFLAGITNDERVKLIKLENMEATYIGQIGKGAKHLLFSPDNRLLIYGSHWDNLIRVCEVETSQIIAMVDTDLTTVAQLAFSANGKYVACLSKDAFEYEGSIEIFEVNY